VERWVLAFLNGWLRSLAPFCISLFTDEAFVERDKDKRELDLEGIVIFWVSSLELCAHPPRLSFYLLSFWQGIIKNIFQTQTGKYFVTTY